MLSAAANFSFNRRRMYLDVMKSRHSFASRTHNASQVLKHEDRKYNTVLQVSALFRSRQSRNILHCSYHDGNTAVSRQAQFSFMSAASPRVMRDSWGYEQRLYNETDLIFTMSDWLRKSMILDFRVPEERVVTVGAGVNFTDADLLRTSSSKPKHYGKKLVLFVGTNFEFKGGPVLLESFRLVRKDIPNAELAIVGCSPPVQQPGVRVLGMLDKQNPAEEQQLRELYEQASLFVLPTLYDAFGIAYVEAMFHRLPCIGSNRCAIPEIIDEGTTGFLVDPQDAKGIADKMTLLLCDEALAQKFGQAGFEHANARFRWDLVVDRMLASMREKLGDTFSADIGGKQEQCEHDLHLFNPN